MTTHVELQEQVVQLLGMTGYEHLHVRRTRGRGGKWTTSTNVKGWPDLFIWGHGRTISAELKIPPDTLRPEQKVVLESHARNGWETYVWRPDDLDDIARILTRGPNPTEATRWPQGATP